MAAGRAPFVTRIRRGKGDDFIGLRPMSSPLTPEAETSVRRLSEPEDEVEEVETFDTTKIKKKFTNVWNNVKYGFNVPYKPSFNENSPIWLLGKCYHSRNSDFVDYPVEKEEHRVLSVEQFFEDFSSLLWLTYRKEFPQLNNSSLTTDCGWGCMLRTGQMLLANTLLIHMLKENWRRVGKFDSYEQNYVYRMILRFFNDEPSEYSPFSLHRLVKVGEENGRKAGDWYGPSSVAHILSKAMVAAAHPYLESIRVYVAQDCTVYKEDVLALSTECRNCNKTKCKDRVWRSVLILVPVRLGGEALNPIYAPCVEALLTLDHCVGIIGGRPKHSLYFVGFQDDKLIHLDPHYVQSTVDMSSKDFSVESFHCPFPRKMASRKMDPSCCIGFYCRTREDFECFCKQTTEVLKPPMQRSEYPMFIFAPGKMPPNLFDMPDGKKHRMSSSLDSFPNSFEIDKIRVETSEHRKHNKHNKRTHSEEYVFVDHS